VEGDAIDYVPDFSFTLGAVYEFNWTAGMPGYFRLNYSYRDEVPYIDRTSFSAENVPQFSDTIGLLDARLGIRRDNVYAELYSQNLTDEREYIDPYHAWNNANRTKPRVIDVKFGVDF
jgi:iron complex outermembrane receptor protein